MKSWRLMSKEADDRMNSRRWRYIGHSSALSDELSRLRASTPWWSSFDIWHKRRNGSYFSLYISLPVSLSHLDEQLLGWAYKSLGITPNGWLGERCFRLAITYFFMMMNKLNINGNIQTIHSTQDGGWRNLASRRGWFPIAMPLRNSILQYCT